MSDRDALLRAICAQPDEDTPRLVFADYLEENDEPERAAFIRAQVELARTPPWEPFAVRCKWQDRAIASGERFADTLPKVDGFNIEWTESPFRRGFGWSLNVRNLSEWIPRVDPLFDLAPIGKVTFWGGVLDDWRRIASSECLKYLREVAFIASPIEPLFAIRDTPAACSITDLHFHRASGAGMPEVLEDLFRSRLGQCVRGLHFKVGYESLHDLIRSINAGGPLERLSFWVMGLTAYHLRQLFEGPAANSLQQLKFHTEPLGDDGLGVLADSLPTTLSDLEMFRVEARNEGWEAFARSDKLANLRRLNISGNTLLPRVTNALSQQAFSTLRSLDVHACNIGEKGVRHITHAKWWPNLVEIDLRDNVIDTHAVKRLLDARIPPNLSALVLSRLALSTKNSTELKSKYGDAVVFV